MNLADFTRLYQAKTDEELAALATEKARLVPEAEAALASELSRRNIQPRVAEHADSLMSEFRSKLPKAPASALQTAKFIEEVLKTYRRKRWAYIKFIFPAVLISYAAVTLARYESRLIMRQLYPRLESGMLHIAVLKISVISATGWLISWVVFSVAFAAICIAVEQEHAGLDISMRDSLAEIRNRLRHFLALSIALLLLFVGLELVVFFTSEGVINLLRSRLGHLSSLTVYLALYALSILALLIFSRFGLAMPALMLDDLGVAQALFRSDELTRGKWSILTVLMFKALVGGYVAGLLPFWLARFIPPDVNLPSWFQWVVVGASILAITVVEPVMFIGFTLLYLKTTDMSIAVETTSAGA